MGTAEPLAIWDARDSSWFRHPLRRERTAWLQDHGLPADEIYRTEFYLLDAPFVRLFCYHRNDEGRRHWNDAHDPLREHDHALCDIAKLPPQDVILSDIPPRDLLYAAA